MNPNPTLLRSAISAWMSLTFLMYLTATTYGELVVNGSFEDGTFVGPGNSHYADFGGGTTGTVIFPGETLLTNWTVFLSPDDPTHAVDYPTPPSGMEWVNVTNGFAVDGTRFVDLNRGGDFFGVSTLLATLPGSSYTINFKATFGGTVRVKALGVGAPLISASDVIPNDLTWRTYTHSFIADALTTTLSFHLEAVGFDPISGAFIDNVSVVPEPGSLALAAAAMFCLFGHCAYCLRPSRKR